MIEGTFSKARKTRVLFSLKLFFDTRRCNGKVYAGKNNWKDLNYILRQNMYSMYDLFLKCYS